MKTCKKTTSFILSLVLVFTMISVGCVSFVSYAEDDGATAVTTVRVTNCESELTIGYKEFRSFEFEAENMPRGAAIHVFYNGEDQGENTYFGVSEPTEDYTIEGKVLDRDGNVLATSGEIKVTVKNGFFDRITASVTKGFRTFGDAVMDIFGAIFMRIWIFLHGGSGSLW